MTLILPLAVADRRDQLPPVPVRCLNCGRVIARMDAGAIRPGTRFAWPCPGCREWNVLGTVQILRRDAGPADDEGG